MAGTARSNFPEGQHLPPTKFDASRTGYGLRPSSLRIGAFHALYDRIYRRRHSLGGVEAGPSQSWRSGGRWSDPRGGGGLWGRADDRRTPERLRAGTYRPAPVRRVEIPKPDGSQAPIGHPDCHRTVCANRQPSSSSNPCSRPTSCPARLGFGPSARPPTPWRGSGLALSKASSLSSRPTSELLRLHRPRETCSRWSESGCRTDGCSSFLRQWLRAGVLVNGVVTETVTGTPQGGVISPLLANIYLHAFDRAWEERGTGEVVRYADDFVVLCSIPGTGRRSPAAGSRPPR